MVVGARKLVTSVLGLVLVGSTLGVPAAVAASPDDAGSSSVGPQNSYTNYNVYLAPNASTVGAPVQLHGYLWDSEARPSIGVELLIYFDPVGTAPREVVDTVITDGYGAFARTFTPRTSGTYEVVAQLAGYVAGTNKADFTVRPADQTVRSGVISASKNGYTAKMRVTTQDVVTRVEAQTVYLDMGIQTLGASAHSDRLPYLSNRRAEGRYRVGEFAAPGSAKLTSNYSGVRAYRMSALHPAGLYDVYSDDVVNVYNEYWDMDRDGITRFTEVQMPHKPITTIRVRRASTTTIAASSTSFTGARNIELRGSLRRVQLVSDTKAENRLAPNIALKLYFDPAGQAGPSYVKTVRTGPTGAYRTTVRATRSGTWIAKYEGTSLQAPSKRSVTVTVR